MGLRFTPGAAATPVPVTATVCGEPEALSTTVKLAVRVPAAVGVKVILNVHEEPDVRIPGQLFVWL